MALLVPPAQAEKGPGPERELIRTHTFRVINPENMIASGRAGNAPHFPGAHVLWLQLVARLSSTVIWKFESEHQLLERTGLF